MWYSGCWELLPDELLLMIFKYLEDHDLVSASATCKQWRRVYYDPCLWRSRTFELRGYCRSHFDRLQTLSKYVKTMGRYMQHIRINCPSPNLLTAYNVAKCVNKVLVGLSRLHQGKTKIQSFEMYQLHFDETWNSFRSSKTLLVNSLSAFIECQYNVKIFKMAYAFLTPPFAYRIMKAFARSKSVRILEVLDILNYYSLEVSTRVIGNQLRCISQRCWKLREISLNYSYLSAANIVDLCEYLDDTLEKLIIYVTVYDHSRCWRFITSDSWTLACKTCPRLKVSFHIEEWPRDAAAFLVPRIPLVEFSSTGNQCRYSALTFGEKTSLLLYHLSYWYPESLQSVKFTAETATFSAPDKSAIITFLAKCQNVKTLYFSSNLLNQDMINQVYAETPKNVAKNIGVVNIV